MVNLAKTPETTISVTPEIVNTFSGMIEADGPAADAFRHETLGLMGLHASGLQLTDQGLFQAVIQKRSLDTAEQVRRGSHVAFRILHQAGAFELPRTQALNAELARSQERILFSQLLMPRFQDAFAAIVTLDYANSPAVVELMDQSNMSAAPRFGGLFVFALFGRAVSPKHRKIPIPEVPAVARTSTSQMRRMASLTGVGRFASAYAR